ncbi:MAG: polysaccharide deacetylase family protein [Acidobacteria bacterium]|nr:polysaccharide deacetylase family protein [Acidobacteriota bacterium]
MSADTVARLMMFWDYDAEWGAERSRLPGGKKAWGPLEATCTERLLHLHANYRVPACFAVVGSVALPGTPPYHNATQVRAIHAAGHEVASHSHRHEWLPGLGPQALIETLHASRAALEDCIGAAVQSFVPPFNQPYDYVAGQSISLAERREAGRMRTDLRRLCDGLRETGYRFCRVAYRPLMQRFAEAVTRRRLDRPVRPERIAGVTCVRLNSAGGFDEPVLRMLDTCVKQRGLLVAYGHPHSLHAGNSQDERHLVPFLARVAAYRDAGALQVVLPAQYYEA